MPNGLGRILTLTALVAVGAIAAPTRAAAGTAITWCTTLDTAGETYVLDRDLESCGTCFVVADDRITIDLAGHTISGSCGRGAGITDDPCFGAEQSCATPRQSTTVKSGTIREFQSGIALGSSTRNVIRNLQVSDNAATGMLLGPRSLVKGCVVERNGQNGIIIGDFGQVQDCAISDHAPPGRIGGVGIFGAGHVLVTHNTVVGNVTGIVVGDFGTVSFNTASDSVVLGLFAGNHSLVTGNTAGGNGSTGILTGGLSTVSWNNASGNGDGGIDVAVGGIFDGAHSLINGNVTSDNGGIGISAQCPSDVTNNTSWGNELDYNLNTPLDGPDCRFVNNK